MPDDRKRRESRPNIVSAVRHVIPARGVLGKRRRFVGRDRRGHFSGGLDSLAELGACRNSTGKLDATESRATKRIALYF
jgi:hypothetical protein